LFGLAPPFEGFAKAAVTDEAAGPVLFPAADFFGLRISRFDRTWPLAMFSLLQDCEVA
jgi:hypothetical protein